MGALQVPLGSLPELMVVMGALKTQKVWFLHLKITLFVNVAFQYFEAFDVLLGHILASWSRSGPETDPKMETKIIQNLVQNRFQKWIGFLRVWINFGPILDPGGPPLVASRVQRS